MLFTFSYYERVLEQRCKRRGHILIQRVSQVIAEVWPHVVEVKGKPVASFSSCLVS